MIMAEMVTCFAASVGDTCVFCISLRHVASDSGSVVRSIKAIFAIEMVLESKVRIRDNGLSFCEERQDKIEQVFFHRVQAPIEKVRQTDRRKAQNVPLTWFLVSLSH